jgi:hypothetical protein
MEEGLKGLASSETRKFYLTSTLPRRYVPGSFPYLLRLLRRYTHTYIHMLSRAGSRTPFLSLERGRCYMYMFVGLPIPQEGLVPIVPSTDRQTVGVGCAGLGTKDGCGV